MASYFEHTTINLTNTGAYNTKYPIQNDAQRFSDSDLNSLNNIIDTYFSKIDALLSAIAEDYANLKQVLNRVQVDEQNGITLATGLIQISDYIQFINNYKSMFRRNITSYARNFINLDMGAFNQWKAYQNEANDKSKAAVV